MYDITKHLQRYIFDEKERIRVSMLNLYIYFLGSLTYMFVKAEGVINYYKSVMVEHNNFTSNINTMVIRRMSL